MKLYLVLMCGPNSLSNLRELIDPIHELFDGIVAVLHDARDSNEHRYLESVKGCGEVIHLHYSRRHDFSRNAYLYLGSIQNGDWCCQIDDRERLSPTFARNLRAFISDIKSRGLTGVWYYGKPLLFEYHESLRYVGNPHEGLTRDDGGMKAIELSAYYPTESDIRYSVRNAQRPDPYHFVRHYLRYYTFPWGSNQTLLGAEHRGNPSEVYRQREIVRAAFRAELERRGVRWHEDAILDYWRNSQLDDVMRGFINGEKILQDAYRYFILDDKTVKDEHDWISLKDV